MTFSTTLESLKKLSTEVWSTSVPAKTLSDNELIEAVKAGEETAFDEIVTRYRQPIINYVCRILNDYEEAVDIAQETFVRVFFALERYQTQFAFSTYIYRIATNLAISEIRKRKRRKLFSLSSFFQSDEEEKAFDVPDSKKLPDKNFIDNEQSRIISKAIEALPEKYRLPIILRDVQEKSYEEVAEILDLSLGTTKSRISRGRGLLREKLKNYL